jgi:inosine-uridine nucleoside N-ribohydrolase
MRFFALLFFTAGTVLAQGVSPTRTTPPMEFPRRIILDVDPGIDDAMAVLLALRSPELKVEAITTVAGNLPVEVETENARKLLELAGRTDVIVAKGAALPLHGKLITAELVHGENGLGGVVLPAPKIALDRRDAVQVIHDLIEANPGQIILMAQGPLTNIAMAFQRYPDLPAKTREIITGGSVGAGLVTPLATPDTYRDAEAAKVVFESGVPILMVDLTAMMEARFTRKDAARLTESSDAVARFVGAISERYLDFVEKNLDPGGNASYFGALGVGIAIDPLIAKTVKPIHVDVETKGEFSYGATVTNLSLTIARFEPRGDRLVFTGFVPVMPNAAYPAVVDGERFARLFGERMLNSPSGTH